MQNLNELKQLVYQFYEANKKISSPVFGLVKLTPSWLWHLENKDKSHKRENKDYTIRMRCFLCIHDIIKKSHLYQEYKKELDDVVIKKNWKKVKIKKTVEYFWLIGIVKTDEWKKTRIKVVLKRVENRDSVEFVSVIPARNIKGYNKLYIEDE